MIRRYLPQSTEEMIHWYERYVAPVALIAGFLLDTYVFLDRVDVLSGNLFLLSYLAIAACGIMLLNAIEAGRLRHRAYLAIAPYVSIVIQFAFGGLFSGYLSLYSRSASFAATWVFIVIIAALLLGNERFRRLYTRMSFQIAIWFTALFSFLIFFLPVVFKYIGPWMFVASGVLSLAIAAVFLYALSYVAPAIFSEQRTRIVRVIAVIFVVFNILYFTNIIPPLPLALKDAGIYHSVSKLSAQSANGALYRLGGEATHWYETFLWRHPTYHRTAGEGMYVFTAIFAPNGLDTTVRHEWEYFEPQKKGWELKSTVNFEIHGGREGGFRGYSFKNAPEVGEWRVTVRTAHGQVIGRLNFMVAEVAMPVEQETTTF